MNIRWLLLVFGPAGALGSLATLRVVPLRYLLGAPAPNSPQSGPGNGPMGFFDTLTLPGLITAEVLVIYLVFPYLAQRIADKRHKKLRVYLTSEATG